MIPPGGLLLVVPTYIYLKPTSFSFMGGVTKKVNNRNLDVRNIFVGWGHIIEHSWGCSLTPSVNAPLKHIGVAR